MTQEVARALRARRNPPPPLVPPMKIDTVRKYAYLVLDHPARREIAESLLILAMRLDVLGFTKPRDQLLLLVGCGLSAADITDSLERRRASETGAQALMEKARSTSATPIERILAQGDGSGRSAGGVSLRERHNTMLHSRRERLRRSKEARAKKATAGAAAPQTSGGEATISGRGPRPEAPKREAQEKDAPSQPSNRLIGRRRRPGSSGPKGPAGRG